MLKNTRRGLANHISYSQANSVRINKNNILDKGIPNDVLSHEVKTTVKIGKNVKVNKTVNTSLTRNNINYLNSSGNQAVSLLDICSCGHDKNYHLNVARCSDRDCKCKRFLP